jgi:hypothetical protein
MVPFLGIRSLDWAKKVRAVSNIRGFIEWFTSCPLPCCDSMIRRVFAVWRSDGLSAHTHS